MTGKRRLAALDVILKAKQHEMTAIGGELSKLRAQQSEIVERIDALDNRRDTESYSASMEAQPFVVTFLKALADERAKAVQAFTELDEKCTALQEQVTEIFMDLEKWRVTRKNLHSSIKSEADRIERAEMDEIGNVMFNHQS